MIQSNKAVWTFDGVMVLCLLLIFTGSAYSKDFYISPMGSDQNPGTKELPFLTINHARNKVRQWNRDHDNENITIWLSGGEYRLKETLIFKLEDSAKPGQIISYQAIPGEKPVINSDASLTSWKKIKEIPEGLPEKSKGHIWTTAVPEMITDFKVMYHGEGMLPRARTKAFPHLRKYNKWVGPEEFHTMIPFEKGVTEDLFHPGNGEIVVVPAAPWTMNILPVQSVDDATGMVHLGSSSTYALAEPRFYMGPEAIWVENTFAGLDSPGEWVFDANQRQIYYWPKDNEFPGDDIVIPRLIEMIRIEGKIDYSGSVDTPVMGLHFEGLTFTHGDRFESAGRTGLGLQHDWERFDASSALFRMRGAENCRVQDCQFSDSGGAAIRLDLYAQNNRILDNEISQIGGTGILLAGYGPGTKDVNRDNVISNNYLHHIGLLWWHSSAIWAWQSGHNLISNNTIHHVPYSAIMVTGRINWDKSGKGECSRTVRWNEVGYFTGGEDWEERERFLHGRENRIEHNDISHVMDVMQDGNGVYISGAGHGNKVIRNFIHDTPSMRAGEAIRCDDDQHETIIESNVVFRYGTHGIGICSKGRNHIFNNIIACPPDRVNRGMLSLEPASPKICAGSQIYNNIFYGTEENQPFVYEQGMKQVMNTINIDRNIYFNLKNYTAADEYLEWARQNGNEKESLQTNPLFEDVENGLFTLEPGSPALKLGFRPFDLKAGRIVKFDKLSDFKVESNWKEVGKVTLDPENDHNMVCEAGKEVFVNFMTSDSKSHLFTQKQFGDIILSVEVMMPRGSNSGIYLQGRYEVQLLDSWGKHKMAYGDMGGIYQRNDPATGKWYEGSAPLKNASLPPGEWQELEIYFRAPRFSDAGKKITDAKFEKVILNGSLVQSQVSFTGPTRSTQFTDEVESGPIMIQGNHGKVAFKNLCVRNW